MSRQQGHVEIGHLAGITGSKQVEWFIRVPGPEHSVLKGSSLAHVVAMVHAPYLTF